MCFHVSGDAGTMKSLTTAQEATGKAHIVVQVSFRSPPLLRAMLTNAAAPQGGVHASQQQIATLAAQMAQAKAAKERKKASKKTT